MATAVPVSTDLRVKYEIEPTEGEENMTYKVKTYKNVRSNASVDDVLAVANALISLQAHRNVTVELAKKEMVI